jgi:hypothetical protein
MKNYTLGKLMDALQEMFNAKFRIIGVPAMQVIKQNKIHIIEIY